MLTEEWGSNYSQVLQAGGSPHRQGIHFGSSGHLETSRASVWHDGACQCLCLKTFCDKTFCFQGEVCQIYDFMLWEMWWNISEICLFVKFNKKLICQCSIHPKCFVTSWLCHKTSRQHLCFDFDIGMVIYSAAERWRAAPRRLERFHGAEWLCNTS